MFQDTIKTAVIYNSKYGSTKRYANWIADEIHADLFEDSEIKINDLSQYNTIVFGGSLHAVGIKGIKLITKNFEILQDKKIIVFAVGCSPAHKEALEQVYNHNFNNTFNGTVHFFYLRGAFNYNDLSAADKLMMNALKAKIKMKKENELDEDAKNLLACYNHPADWTDKKAILPIVECIKG